MGCGAPCNVTPTQTESVCHASDAGVMEPGRPFFLDVETTAYGGTNASCDVTVDGGLLSISVTATVCPSSNSNLPVVPPPAIARCAVPALDAGSYAIATRVRTVALALGSTDAGIAPCR